MKIKDVDRDTLDNYEIRRFDTVDEAFDFYFDEDETRDSIVKELSVDIKKDILANQHNIYLIDGSYYFGYDENGFDHLKEEVLGDDFRTISNYAKIHSALSNFCTMMNKEVKGIIDMLKMDNENGYYSVNMNDLISAQGPQIDIPLLTQMLEENELVDSVSIEDDCLVIYSSSLAEDETVKMRAAQEENYDKHFNMSM